MKRFTIQYQKDKTSISEVKVNNECLLIIESDDPNIKVSDEYHTMDELYQHRMALNIALFQAIRRNYEVMKSKLHHDGTMFDGYFIVMAITPLGQISYHYHLKYWDKFDLYEVNRTPEYDGHTSLDVLDRLERL